VFPGNCGSRILFILEVIILFYENKDKKEGRHVKDLSLEIKISARLFGCF